jgi:hypothetical protein
MTLQHLRIVSIGDIDVFVAEGEDAAETVGEAGLLAIRLSGEIDGSTGWPVSLDQASTFGEVSQAKMRRPSALIATLNTSPASSGEKIRGRCRQTPGHTGPLSRSADPSVEPVVRCGSAAVAVLIG